MASRALGGLNLPMNVMAMKPPIPPCGLRMCGDIVESSHWAKLMAGMRHAEGVVCWMLLSSRSSGRCDI